MPKDTLLFTHALHAATVEIQTLEGRITQQFTNNVFIASLPDTIDAGALKMSRQTPFGMLDEVSQLAVDAWNALQTNRLKTKRTDVSTEGLSWATPGFDSPRKLDDLLREAEEDNSPAGEIVKAASVPENITAVNDRNNCLHVWGIGMDNIEYLNWRYKGEWSGWIPNWNDSPKLKPLSAVNDKNNCLQVWGIGMDNVEYCNSRDIRGVWGGWIAKWGL